MNKDELIKEKISNLKDFRHTLMLALITLTGGLGTIFIYFADIKTNTEFIFRIIVFILGLIVDIILFYLIREANKDIQLTLINQEIENND